MIKPYITDNIHLNNTILSINFGSNLSLSYEPSSALLCMIMIHD